MCVYFFIQVLSKIIYVFYFHQRQIFIDNNYLFVFIIRNTIDVIETTYTHSKASSKPLVHAKPIYILPQIRAWSNVLDKFMNFITKIQHDR